MSARVLSPPVGSRFGRLTVASFSWPDGQRRVECRCDCGRATSVTPNNLSSGQVSSCGCLSAESSAARVRAMNTRHGDTWKGGDAPEYRSWRSMIQRCTNPKHPAFHRYGGRGIVICAAWRESYEAFLADMGRRPSAQHSIDRYPNNDGNYEPGNCRWATPVQQAHNRQNGRRVHP